MEAIALKERENHFYVKGEAPFDIVCNKDSLAGAVSQRACVFCGSRVVLYPIADALHLVHGPIGCAVYTWDIRGALSSGPELHRLSFSTDLQEQDVIFGGEKKLAAALLELIARHSAQGSLCLFHLHRRHHRRRPRGGLPTVAAEDGIPVIPVKSEGFKGNKRAGYQAACNAIFRSGRQRRYQRHLALQHQYPGRLQPGRRDLDDPRLLQAHGHRGGGEHHRRRAGGRYPPLPTARP